MEPQLKDLESFLEMLNKLNAHPINKFTSKTAAIIISKSANVYFVEARRFDKYWNEQPNIKAEYWFWSHVYRRAPVPASIELEKYKTLSVEYLERDLEETMSDMVIYCEMVKYINLTIEIMTLTLSMMDKYDFWSL